MASFAGAACEERGSNDSRFGRQELAVYVYAGTRQVKQTAGAKRDPMSMPVLVTQSQYTALMAKVGTIGSLIWSGGTRQANLDAISDPTEIWDLGEVECTLEFTGF